MLLIGRAWKANINAWKRHLILQSIFNHGEWMMHVDKNADGHVMDQNVDRILKEIVYVPLSGRIRSKCSSCMQPFFFFFFFEKKWVQDMLTSGRDKMRISIMILNFGHASQRSYRLEFWTCFVEVRWIWILDVLPRGPMVWSLDVHPRGPMDLNLDVLPRGPMDWILDMLHRGPMDLNLNMHPRGPMDLKFGRASQRSSGFEFWTCILEVRWIWKVLFIPMCVGLLP